MSVVMSLDPISVPSNPSSSRATRGAIAAQACDTCRERKQKCDEERPKCGLCQRRMRECRYSEPQPTKRDRTLVDILSRLDSLESKIDRIPPRGPEPTGFGPPQSVPNSLPSFSTDIDEPSTSSSPGLAEQPSPSGPEKRQPYRHASAAHKVLTWPAIQELLFEALPANIRDLKSLEQDGPGFITRIQEGTPKLALDEGLQDMAFSAIQSQASRIAGEVRTTFLHLTRDIMHQLATAYFDTFNLIYPFMDRQGFISDTLIKVYTEGFNDDTDSVIALLIFVLGEISIEGSCRDSIEVYKHHPKGVGGGIPLQPPGLALFNKARKRIGFVLTDYELENIQIYSLAVLYYECSSRHFEFWRMMVSASLVCQLLITCKQSNLNSARGDLIKRVYWHCVVMETALQLELDLPPTGISGLADRVGFPSFSSPFCKADERANQFSYFEAHYATQVTLQRLCAKLHQNINDSSTNNSSDTPSASSDDYGGPERGTLKQLAIQLSEWRGMLPRDLQWAEDDPASFPGLQQADSCDLDHALDPDSLLHQAQSRMPLFSIDQNKEPIQYPYFYNIQVALLRTRYYQAKYMIYRPFVYKALHFPEQMTQEDAEGVAECLRSCLKWPITLSPTSRQKRLVPYLFCWSQNLLGILLLIHMTRHNSMLSYIRAQLCGPRFEAEIDETVELMLEWVGDLQTTDPIALWCLQILQGVYHLE
ncbi:hypothetical protein OIDMADRAFT_173784 [Oidiodendron maius Zn]|uniref:Zn(2)-C6 fungal-type domain-containing protein n=1 Tax=Oidiodendron maius (strain Zn) TaxID=913774 RepID=A0A0C3C1N2_OIDMZ|nr:hypothetical protein OIDMADRAFT_173784 [Oidiodendron maius Zn]